RSKAAFVVRNGVLGLSLARFNHVGVVFEIGLGVVGHNKERLRVEQVADFIADQIENRLKVELGRQALLDAVNNRQFRRALLLRLKKALGFIEQARIFEGDAHGRREGLQQPYVGFAKSVLMVNVLETDDARDLIPNHHWDKEQ